MHTNMIEIPQDLQTSDHNKPHPIAIRQLHTRLMAYTYIVSQLN